jgi:WD40 repeat protein
MQDRFPIAQRPNGSAELSQVAETTPIAELTSHKGAVSGVAFASEGRWIVSSSRDGTLKVWSSATNRLLRTLQLNAGPASALAAQGQRAVSGHEDGTVALWDLETNERLAAFKRSDASIWSVTFAGDPDRFAAASFDWTVTLYDAKSNTGAVHVFEGHENTIRSLAYSTGGSVPASGGADRTVRLWNAAAYAPIRTYRGHNDYVTALALSQDGRTLASASSDGAIRIWSTNTNQAFRTLRGHNATIAALAFSPDGQILASAGSDAAIRLWSVKRGEAMRTLLAHEGEVLSVSFSPDGRRLASGGGDGIVRLWDASGLRPAS